MAGIRGLEAAVIAALARRAGNRAAAAALAVMLAAAYMMLGAGTANAAPREVVCTISPTPIPAPVAVTEGDQVQLVLDLRSLGLGMVAVGPTRTANTPGEQVMQEMFGGILGLVAGGLCRAAVLVQSTVTSAVPLPPLPSVPTVPPLVPSESVQVPLPGVELSVETGGTGSPPGTDDPGTSPPGSSPPGTHPPGAPGGSAPNYRYDPSRLQLYDFASVPYGVSTRFGAAAAPAFRFGQQVPGYAPQFGILGAEDAKDVAAGKVRALPLGGHTAVGLPVLLAVLMLSTVSGALVRTWALRRAA